MRQKHASQDELLVTLAYQPRGRDLRLAETTLALCLPEVALAALAAIQEKERHTQRLRRSLGRLSTYIAGGAYIVWVLSQLGQMEWPTFLLVGLVLRLVLGIVASASKAPTLRHQSVRFVAASSILRASRSSLGPVLILAEAGLRGAGPERNACREFLEVALVRAPVSEIVALTRAQQRALRTVTRDAITCAQTDDRYTRLASAGLLALGTLHDPGLAELATALRHRQETIRAAATEYLSQL